jgi:hypothetical protein
MSAKAKIIALACVALVSLTGTASAHHGANTTKAWAGKVAGTTAATDPATAIRDRHGHHRHGGLHRAHGANSGDPGHDCNKGADDGQPATA